MLIYISGPITGHLDTYKATFAAAADTIRKGGHEPVNPATIQLDDGASWSDYMDTALNMLWGSDGIYMLPGWRDSRGARVESKVADRLGLRRFGSPV